MVRRYPIRSDNIIAHIRKATQGRVALENTHPFQRELWGRYWVFAHNGDLKNYAPRLHSAFRPVGSTDSELAFCWLMQELAKAMPACRRSRADRDAARAGAGIAAHGTFNFMLSNGEALWVHCATKLSYHRAPASVQERAKLQDDDISVNFAELTTPNDRVAVIVTEPLTCDEEWTALAPGELLAFANGAPLAG
jgi:glutamine amidotransferase